MLYKSFEKKTNCRSGYSQVISLKKLVSKNYFLVIDLNSSYVSTKRESRGKLFETVEAVAE